MSAEKRTALAWFEEFWPEATRLADRIWQYSEPSLREYRSARAHSEFLERHGFAVEQGVAGLPTAFIATFGSGPPVIATYAEYDATPGQSQEPVPYRKPRVPHAAGFTDAHHMLGVAASAGAIAAARSLQQHRLPGTVKVFGTPAEKLYVGKPYMAKAGCFEGVDAFCTWHPGHTTNNYNTTRLEIASGSSYLVLFTFECDEPWKWSGIGGLAGVRHPGALEGAVALYTLAKFLRDHMLPRTGGWAIAEHMMTGGQGTVDNWPPDIAQIVYEFHCPELEMQETILRILQNCAESAAQATYTKVRTRVISKSRPGIPSVTLGRLMYRNLELVGAPRFTQEQKAFAKTMLRNFGVEPPEEPFNETLTPPDTAEQEARQYMTPLQRHRGTDDSSELGWYAPMGRLMVSGTAVRSVPGVVYPLWFEAALSGTSAAHTMGLVAAKTIALSMVELLTTPAELERALAEQRERMARGILAPLLPPDLAPPLDLRWPEWSDNRYPQEPLADLRWSVPAPR